MGFDEGVGGVVCPELSFVSFANWTKGRAREAEIPYTANLDAIPSVLSAPPSSALEYPPSYTFDV